MYRGVEIWPCEEVGRSVITLNRNLAVMHRDFDPNDLPCFKRKYDEAFGENPVTQYEAWDRYEVLGLFIFMVGLIVICFGTCYLFWKAGL